MVLRADFTPDIYVRIFTEVYRRLDKDNEPIPNFTESPLTSEEEQSISIITAMWEREIRGCPDIDLNTEREYLLREIVEYSQDKCRLSYVRTRTRLALNLKILETEIARRKKLAKLGAPRFKNTLFLAPEQIREMVQGIDLVDLIGRVVDLKTLGKGRWVGKCPIHHDRNPSLVVYADEHRFHCFGCQIGGTAIDWIMISKGLSLSQAIEDLKTYSRISNPDLLEAYPEVKKELGWAKPKVLTSQSVGKKADAMRKERKVQED